jgi:hypothetical protein
MVLALIIVVMAIIFEDYDFKEAPFCDKWDDLYANIDEGTGPAALTYEAYRDTGFYMRFFRHNQNDSIFMSYQMSHQWDPTTAVRPHMYYFPMASGSGDVKFNYAYAWINVGDTLPSAIGWTSGSVSASLDPSMQYKQKVIGFGTLVPTNQVESSILVLKVERPASDSADTYSTNKDHQTPSANLGIIFFDLHYQKIKAGTSTPFPES